MLFLEDLGHLGSILQILTFSRHSDSLRPRKPYSPKPCGPGHAVIILTGSVSLSWPPAGASYTLTAPRGGPWPLSAPEGHQRIPWGERWQLVLKPQQRLFLQCNTPRDHHVLVLMQMCTVLLQIWAFSQSLTACGSV